MHDEAYHPSERGSDVDRDQPSAAIASAIACCSALSASAALTRSLSLYAASRSASACFASARAACSFALSVPVLGVVGVVGVLPLLESGVSVPELPPKSAFSD